MTILDRIYQRIDKNPLSPDLITSDQLNEWLKDAILEIGTLIPTIVIRDYATYKLYSYSTVSDENWMLAKYGNYILKFDNKDTNDRQKFRYIESTFNGYKAFEINITELAKYLDKRSIFKVNYTQPIVTTLNNTKYMFPVVKSNEIIADLANKAQALVYEYPLDVTINDSIIHNFPMQLHEAVILYISYHYRIAELKHTLTKIYQLRFKEVIPPLPPVFKEEFIDPVEIEPITITPLEPLLPISFNETLTIPAITFNPVVIDEISPFPDMEVGNITIDPITLDELSIGNITIDENIDVPSIVLDKFTTESINVEQLGTFPDIPIMVTPTLAEADPFPEVTLPDLPVDPVILPTIGITIDNFDENPELTLARKYAAGTTISPDGFEDIEITTAELNILQTRISVWKTKVEAAIENARLGDSRNAAILSAYKAKVEAYLAAVQLAIAKLNLWSTKRQTQLEEYRSRINAEVTKFTGQLEGYKTEVQKVFKEVELKLQAAIQNQQTDLQTKVQNQQNSVTILLKNLEKDLQIAFKNKENKIQEIFANFKKEVDTKLAEYDKKAQAKFQSKANELQVKIQNLEKELKIKFKDREDKLQILLTNLQTKVQTALANMQNELQVAIKNVDNEIMKQIKLYDTKLQLVLRQRDEQFQILMVNFQKQVEVAFANQSNYIQVALANQNMHYQIVVTNIRNKIDLYTNDIQKYGIEVQDKIQEFQSELGKWTQYYSAIVQHAQLLKQEYNEQLQKYLGGNNA